MPQNYLHIDVKVTFVYYFCRCNWKKYCQFCCFLVCQTCLMLSWNCSLTIFIILCKQSLQKWKI